MDGVIGEIRMFAGNFAPRSWALCEGQELSIQANQDLFSIIGNVFGGNGHTNFALPDVRGRVVVGAGNGPGGTPYTNGEKLGSPTTTLSVSNLPKHQHNVVTRMSNTATQPSPQNAFYAKVSGVTHETPPRTVQVGMFSESQDRSMNANMVTCADSGNGLPIPNMMPCQAVNFIICLKGKYPQRQK